MIRGVAASRSRGAARRSSRHVLHECRGDEEDLPFGHRAGLLECASFHPLCKMTEPRMHRPPLTWLYLALAGCALVLLTLLVTALVILDKEHFGWMVGSHFLPMITVTIFIGAALLLVAAWKLPARRTWRGIVLMVWALIALTSPLFGILFLLPWGVLVLMLPVVIAILVTLFRAAKSTDPALPLAP
jgi:hypothetical protein